LHDRDLVPKPPLGALEVATGPNPNKTRGLIRQSRRNRGLLLTLLLALLILAVFSPKYMNLNNFVVVGLQMSYIGIAAIGTAYLIISGNIDLSIGSLFALCAAVAAILSLSINPHLALVVGVAVGGLLGLVNGMLVWRIKISPIIITLGSLTIIRGADLLLTGGYTIRGVPESFTAIGQWRPLDVPTSLWVFLILAVIAHFILHDTTIGRHIFAIGGNREASEASGLTVRRLTLGVFAVNGVIVGVAGVLAASRFGTAAPSFGIGYELDVITAVILGGVAFNGGEGNIVGVILAVMLLGVINSGLVSLGIDPHYTEVVKGTALILAVTLDQLSQERQDRFRTILARRERERA
jgi:ribose transport system permease protein